MREIQAAAAANHDLPPKDPSPNSVMRRMASVCLQSSNGCLTVSSRARARQGENIGRLAIMKGQL